MVKPSHFNRICLSVFLVLYSLCYVINHVKSFPSNDFEELLQLEREVERRPLNDYLQSPVTTRSPPIADDVTVNSETVVRKQRNNSVLLELLEEILKESMESDDKEYDGLKTLLRSFVQESGTAENAKVADNVLTETLAAMTEENSRLNNLRHLVESDPELPDVARLQYSSWLKEALHYQSNMKEILDDLRSKLAISSRQGMTMKERAAYQSDVERAINVEADKALRLVQLKEALLTKVGPSLKIISSNTGPQVTDTSESAHEGLYTTESLLGQIAGSSSWEVEATTVNTQGLIVETEDEIKLQENTPALFESDIGDINLNVRSSTNSASEYGFKPRQLGGRPLGPIAVREQIREKYGHRFTPEPWANILWTEPKMLENCWIQAMMADRYQFSPSCNADGTFSSKQCYLERCWCTNKDGSAQFLEQAKRFHYGVAGVTLKCNQN